MSKYVVLGWTGLCIVGWLVLVFTVEEDPDCSLFCLTPGWIFVIVSVGAVVVWIGGLVALAVISYLLELWAWLRSRRH